MLETTDQLTPVLDRVESWCAEHNVRLIYGEVESHGQLPEVTFKGASGDSHETFLKSLEGASIAAVVIHILRLTRAIWQEKIDELEDAETPEGKARLREIQKCENLIGRIQMIEIDAFFDKPQLVLQFCHRADWDSLFSDDGEIFAGEAEEPWEDLRTSPRGEALARRVANDPKFAAAKKQAERQYIAKTVLRDEKMDARDIYHIAQQAASIFEIEIKPTLDAALTDQAEKLKKDGHSTAEIAKRLNLTTREVKRLLE